MNEQQLLNVSEDKAREYLALVDQLSKIDKRETSQDNFLSFVKEVWPTFIEGAHHKHYAKKLQAIADGTNKSLIVNMPPRHTKSEFASNLFPAWLIGRNPQLKIIQTTHTGELAVNFGRKMRNTIASPEYRLIFPTTRIKADVKAAGRWETEQGGEFFASGVGGAITGRGADLLIIDDPHSEQDAMNENSMELTYEWYTSGPRQRLQPGGAIILVMTRWSTKDLTAKLLKAQSRDIKADQWEIVEFPAIFPDTNNPLWPGFWKFEELENIRASLSVTKWNAQWLQKPTLDEGAIVKREWWRKWEHEELPKNTDFIIQSYDTAFTKKETADYSAITTWGVFYPNEDSGPNIILLDSKKGRWEFPDLKRIALKNWNYWEPDIAIIEAKASGLPLLQELRAVGIPVSNFTPSRGQDKNSRLHAIAPLFEAGLVWAPDTKWAEEVMEECAEFPNGDHDDLMDSTTQALLRFRQGSFIKHPEDYKDEKRSKEKKIYY